MRAMTKAADLLQGLRDLGLTQAAIAKMAGISQAKVSRWETNGAPVAADDALKLRSLLEAEKAKRTRRPKVAA